MRVAVLGAGGETGRRVTRDLTEHPAVSRAEYIDIQGKQAHAIDPRASKSIVAALSDAEVAVGCLEGDIDREIAVGEAAISKGIPYLSTCEGGEVFEALQSLDERARASGVLVLAGLGLSPGLSNILAIHGTESMDEVHRVEVSWVVSMGGELGPAAFRRAIGSLAGSPPTFSEGAWQRSPAGTSGKLVYFPEPVGWRRVHLCDGSEVLSLPKSLSAREVTVRGGVTEKALDRIARNVSDAPSLSRSTGKHRLLGSAQRFLPWLGRLSGPRHTWSAMRVDVEGSSGGTNRTVTFGVMDQYANLVSAPLVTGTVMVGRGEIKGAGVLSAEVAISASNFLPALAQRGVRVARLQR